MGRTPSGVRSSPIAESLGYDVMVHCPAPRADPTTPVWQAWIAEQPVPAGCRTVGFDEVDLHTFNSVWLGYDQWAHERWAPTYGPERLALRPDQPEVESLARAAAAQSLDRLGRRGVRLAEFEGHDTDPHVPGLFASFPPHDSDPMDVIRLHRPQR